MEPPAPDAPGSQNLTAVPSILRVWFGVNAEVTRGVYAASGLGLMTLKYCVETVATLHRRPLADAVGISHTAAQQPRGHSHTGSRLGGLGHARLDVAFRLDRVLDERKAGC